MLPGRSRGAPSNALQLLASLILAISEESQCRVLACKDEIDTSMAMLPFCEALGSLREQQLDAHV